MKNFLTKKNVLWGALIGAGLSYVAMFPSFLGLCSLIQNSSCQFSFTVFSIAEASFRLLLSLSLVAAILFFISDIVYSSWFSFVQWWIPFSVFIIILLPVHDQSLLSLTKEVGGLFMSGLFLVISLILIAYKHFTLKKGEVEK